MAIPSNNLFVFLVQMNSNDSFCDNFSQIQSILSEALTQGEFDLIVFPENALYLKIGSSSPVGEFNLQEPEFAELFEWCQKYQKTIMLGAVPVRQGEGLYNATVLVTPQAPAKVVYKKIHLFDVEVDGALSVRESDQFNHGSKPAIVTIGGWKIGLSICYDVRFSELYARYAKEEVDLIMVPSAFLVPTGKAHWHTLLRARAIESQCFVLAPAQIGPHISVVKGQRESFGHSLAVAPWGEVIADLAHLPSGGRVIELDAALLSRTRTQIPMTNHRRL